MAEFILTTVKGRTEEVIFSLAKNKAEWSIGSQAYMISDLCLALNLLVLTGMDVLGGLYLPPCVLMGFNGSLFLSISLPSTPLFVTSTARS